MKIVVLDGYSANPGDLSWEQLQQLGTLTVYERTTKDMVIERAKDADIVLTNKVVLDKDVLEQLPHLKYIGVIATGTNVVDIAQAHKQGITVTNVPAYSTDSVAQMVFSLILTICNHTEYYAKQNRQGHWCKSKDFCYWEHPLTELAGKQIGIVGLGNIGQKVAKIAQAFSMQVAAVSSKNAEELQALGIQKMAFTDLLSSSDIVSLHCPLTQETRHMINADTIGLMKPTAILINTGRGPLIDEDALAKALKEGQIAAAGMDVLSQEPPQVNNPLIPLENCYITPHIAWASYEARTRLLRVVYDNVKAFIEGHPQNVV